MKKYSLPYKISFIAAFIFTLLFNPFIYVIPSNAHFNTFIPHAHVCLISSYTCNSDYQFTLPELLITRATMNTHPDILKISLIFFLISYCLFTFVFFLNTRIYNLLAIHQQGKNRWVEILWKIILAGVAIFLLYTDYTVLTSGLVSIPF